MHLDPSSHGQSEEKLPQKPQGELQNEGSLDRLSKSRDCHMRVVHGTKLHLSPTEPVRPLKLAQTPGNSLSLFAYSSITCLHHWDFLTLPASICKQNVPVEKTLQSPGKEKESLRCAVQQTVRGCVQNDSAFYLYSPSATVRLHLSV